MRKSPNTLRLGSLSLAVLKDDRRDAIASAESVLGHMLVSGETPDFARFPALHRALILKALNAYRNGETT